MHDPTVRRSPRNVNSLANRNGWGIRYKVDEIISELDVALIECGAHMTMRTNDDQGLEKLREVARRIEHALDLLKSVQRPASASANGSAP